MSENEILENIKKEIERIKEDSIYSAKGHFESAKYRRYGNYVLMVASIASMGYENAKKQIEVDKNMQYQIDKEQK